VPEALGCTVTTGPARPEGALASPNMSPSADSRKSADLTGMAVVPILVTVTLTLIRTVVEGAIGAIVGALTDRIRSGN
jgi:hypothetical protein